MENLMNNLRLREIPNCFFHLAEGCEARTGDSFPDFAKLVEASGSGCGE